MELDPTLCYRALAARDARFDGAFFVGVSSTGIYCRSVCPARTPKPENCTFYASAAAAQRAGYRPCLRCHPERAPQNRHVDGRGAVASRALSLIEDGAGGEAAGVGTVAARIGIGERQLRRIVQTELGASPVEMAQTQRLLLAKRLLTETDLPVTEIAFASGFHSVRRFNTLFKEKLHVNPSQVRRAGSAPSPSLVCEIAYRPPLDWEFLTGFLSGRHVRGVETMDGARYVRALQMGDHAGWATIEPSGGERHTLRVEVSASLAPVLPQVLARVKTVFDLNADPAIIARHLGPLAEARPGLRVPGAWDGFEMAFRAILGQQITVKAATTLSGRLSHRFGVPFATPWADVTHLTPTPEALADATEDEIAALGIIGARARSLIALARAVRDQGLVLEPGADVEQTLTTLIALPGIGPWTAQYIALRALSWPDAFPHTDLGIMKALGTRNPREILTLAEKWRPFRAYAVLHLWASLGDTPPLAEEKAS